MISHDPGADRPVLELPEHVARLVVAAEHDEPTSADYPLFGRIRIGASLEADRLAAALGPQMRSDRAFTLLVEAAHRWVAQAARTDDGLDALLSCTDEAAAALSVDTWEGILTELSRFIRRRGHTGLVPAMERRPFRARWNRYVARPRRRQAAGSATVHRPVTPPIR